MILSDTSEKHTAVYMIPGNASDGFMAALGELLENDRLNHVQWAAGDAMPDLSQAVPHAFNTAE